MNHGRSSTGMEVTSMVFGIAALALSTCLYISIPMAGLAIILALLSRGSKMQLGTKAKIGLWLAIGGLCATLLFYALVILVMLHRYGSFEAIYAELQKYNGLSLSELLQQYSNMAQ